MVLENEERLRQEKADSDAATGFITFVGGTLAASYGVESLSERDSTDPESNHFVSTEVASREVTVSLEQAGLGAMTFAGAALAVAGITKAFRNNRRS